MRLIDVDLYCATICKCNRRECDKAKCHIHNAPTAYDIDKVVEELEEYLINYGVPKKSRIHQRIIAIVKQGCVGKDVE